MLPRRAGQGSEGGALRTGVEHTETNSPRRVWATAHRWIGAVRTRLNAAAATDDGVAPRRPAIMFVGVLVGYPIFLLMTQSSWLLGGEMWAEMATNYYANATSGSLSRALFSTDAGYVPFLLRIVAAIPAYLGATAAATPYVYTWTAVIGTAVLVGAFVLRWFRQVLASDWARLSVVVAVLVVADFESRTFINFTYFATLFITVCAVSAAVSSRDVPRWMWVTPLLLLTKPAVLVAVPVVVIAAIVARRRYRMIAIGVVVAAALQAVQLIASSAAGFSTAPPTDWTFVDKASSSVKFGLGLLGGFPLGADVAPSPAVSMVLGALILAVVVFLVIWSRRASALLALAGAWLVIGNSIVAAFALSWWWNPSSVALVISLPISRQSIVAYAGSVLLVAGLIAALVEIASSRVGPESPRLRRWVAVAVAPLFLVWFVGSGWFSQGIDLSRTPGWPVVGSSGWQRNAAAIDAGGVVCVPIDPLGWSFQRGCSISSSDRIRSVEWVAVRAGVPYEFDLTIADDAVLDSFAIGVRPSGSTEALVTAQASAAEVGTVADARLSASQSVSVGGSLLQFTGRDIPAWQLEGVVRVSATFDTDVMVAVVPVDDSDPEQGRRPLQTVWVAR